MIGLVKISKITAQKKNKQRFNIFLKDGEKDYYAFSVDEAILVKNMLRKDMELTDAELENLMKETSSYKAYSLCIQFLSYRMRTKREIYNYLIKKEIDEEAIPEIIDRLVREKLVDDREFALMFTRTRIQTSLKGPTVVKQEIMEKGVTSEIADEAIELFTYDIQKEKAEKLLDKKSKQQQKHSHFKEKQKLQQHLMEKGFRGDVVKELLEEWNEQKDTSEEWNAVKYQGERLWRRHSKQLTGYSLNQKVKQGLYQRGFNREWIEKFLNEAEEDM